MGNRIYILGAGKMGLIINALLGFRGYRPIIVDFKIPTFKQLGLADGIPSIPFFFHDCIPPLTTSKKIVIRKELLNLNSSSDVSRDYSLKTYGITCDDVNMEYLIGGVDVPSWELNMPVLEEYFYKSIFIQGKFDVSKFVEYKIIQNKLNGDFIGVDDYDYIFSTIPMMSWFGKRDNIFPYRDVYIRAFKGQSRNDGNPIIQYDSDIDDPVYRRTIIGDMVLEESTAPIFRDRVFAKIYNYNGSDGERLKRLRALENCGVICFGRYAIWDPKRFIHEEVKRAKEFIEEMFPIIGGRDAC